jgi:murein DD-endopeptidase MepM/ murein hydrolase activator NlpD
MRTIKTRNTVKGIKVLDKTVNLSKRMKDATIRTKERAEETQSARHASPAEYANDSVQHTAQDITRETVHHLPNPRQKAAENWNRAKGHFQEVKRQMPKERQRAAEQALKTAVKTKDSAETLKNTAENAQKTANEAKTAVRDAKQTLKETRQAGRQTVREVRQSVKYNRTPETPPTASGPVEPPRVKGSQTAEAPKPENPAKRSFIKKRAQTRAENARLNGKNAQRPDSPTPARGADSPGSGNGPVEPPRVKGSQTAEVPKAENPAKRDFMKKRAQARAENARLSGKNAQMPDKPTSANPTRGAANPGKPVNAPGGSAPPAGGSRPGYMSIRPAKSAGDAAKTVDKSAKTAKSTAKSFKKTAKGTVKTAKKSVKTAEKSAKAAVKTAKQTAKTAQKTAQAAVKAAKAAEKAARAAAKAAVQAAKIAVKVTIAMVKAAIAAIKGLVAAIAAGGWVAVVVVLIICLIGLLVGSIFGIFFSGEDTGTGRSMPSVVTELTTEFYDQIEQIKADNPHDVLDEDAMAINWPEVLAVYAVKVNTDPDGTEVATFDDDKVEKLRGILRDMVTLSYSLRTDTWERTVLNDEGEEVTEVETITTLVISLTQKSADDTAALYGFSQTRKDQLHELLSPEYADLWAQLLGGYVIGDGTIYTGSGAYIPKDIFSWPLADSYPITSRFGYRKDPFTGETKYHGGIDLGAPAGVPIIAAAGGTVIVANSTDSWGGGYGYYVKIQHEGGYATVYAHASQIAVVNGQEVVKGQVVAYVGSTGRSTGNHLHFEVWKDGARTDPLGYFE